jgi:hypothetical protein
MPENSPAPETLRLHGLPSAGDYPRNDAHQHNFFSMSFPLIFSGYEDQTFIKRMENEFVNGRAYPARDHADCCQGKSDKKGVNALDGEAFNIRSKSRPGPHRIIL